MKYRKSSLKYIQSLDEIYEMLIESYKIPETRFHPSAGDFSFLVNFEEELEVFKNKAFEWRTVDNTLVGIDWTDYRGTYYIITRQTNDEIYSIILNDIESRHSESEEIWVWNCETNMVRCSELQRRNYMTNGWYIFYGHKSLVDFVPMVNMPNGYAVRELTDTDIPAKVKLMGVSMGEACNRTIEKYRNMQKSIVYERMTDLVVVDSNNTLVSFCNGWLDRKNAIGAIEPCGISDEHSGKGLMTNLMNHLFTIYRQNGINDVYIPHGDYVHTKMRMTML